METRDGTQNETNDTMHTSEDANATEKAQSKNHVKVEEKKRSHSGNKCSLRPTTFLSCQRYH